MSHIDVSLQTTLDRLAFTRGLDREQQDRVAEIATLVAWEAGAIVFREGDRDSLLYVVDKGRLALEIAIPGRGRVTMLTVGPGEVFGWSSLFSGATRPRRPGRSNPPGLLLWTRSGSVPFATPTRAWATS